ncbi:MAG TPA: DNA polymerase III subunit gamma/tau, partial [Chroococcales cyanobacterium]
TDDSAHIDIIEIDAASNRRIDEIRDLREKVYVAPVSSKYKVYIIDEVHMLTKEAFNALLKTLEEPPAHVVFILATTEAHKLPETIISRTQRYTFKPVELAKVVAHLKAIADKEKIKVSDEALELIARHGDGSFRDSISLLDQAGSHKKAITIDDVRTLLGMPPEEAIDTLLRTVTSGDITQLVATLNELQMQGYQPAAIAKQLAAHIRHELLQQESSLATRDATMLLSRLIDVPASHDPERYLEVTLLEALPPSTITSPASATVTPPTTIEPPQPKPATPKKIATVTRPEPPIEPENPEASEPSPQSEADTDPTGAENEPSGVLDEAVWPQVLGSLKNRYNTLYGIVRMAAPTFEDDKVTLRFGFAFHQKRVHEAKNQQIIADTIKKLTGHTVIIECLLDKNAKPPALNATPVSKPVPPPTGTLTNISNIFGGGELLESD